MSTLPKNVRPLMPWSDLIKFKVTSNISYKLKLLAHLLTIIIVHVHFVKITRFIKLLHLAIEIAKCCINVFLYTLFQLTKNEE